jgi:hypothetical protein
MKTSVLSILAMLGLGAALGSVRLMAKAPIHATIPFDFTVGAKSFAAGDYSVWEMTPSVLAIRTANGRSKMLTIAHSAEPNDKPGVATLTFHRYGDRYFLSRVSNNDRGWELAKSVVEKELIAKRAEPTKPVSVVASSSK